MEPWFFWDEEPEESKPGRFSKAIKGGKAAKGPKPEKRAKTGRPAKAAEPEKSGKPARTGAPEQAGDLRQVASAAPVGDFWQVAKPQPAGDFWQVAKPEPAGDFWQVAKPEPAGDLWQSTRSEPADGPAKAAKPEKPKPAKAAPQADPESGHRGSRARMVRRPIAVAAVLAGLLAVAGGAVGLSRLTGRPGDVPRPLAKSSPAPHGSFAAPPQPHSSARVARPVALTIPAIGVKTKLEKLGRTPQGTLQVPDTTTIAGWYTGSPRPGEIGSSIIAGHIDSTLGPGVFFRLRLLRRGDRAYVRRSDGTLAVFRVYAERMYPKNHFPTEQVYGPVPDAELHLITCGGVFDSQTGSYLSNVVVYATQVSVRHPRHHHQGRPRGHHPRARHS